MPTEHLADLLARVFGHSGFRAHQREVCEAAASGRDVLLVMPTGAGKSLCYQLPALARSAAGPSAAALVISPLIALMDDQAAKLASLGLRVARIHSGLSREDARQACRDYLDGTLDFLFIAPERLRVPGFPEMLAKRKPALIAIDEAHCISQWGHDFRPDYRTLGQHLRALRPSPVIALTATATPAVQRDIAVQLGLEDPAIFITGFRRDNLAVEVVEMSKPERKDFTRRLLSDPAARPAIVYAGSRKQAEELADELNRHFPARAYHAGLESSLRERTQTDFLSGKLDAVVATVAFGMGVDKADIRTVVHVALPGSLEAFYQEIGRAGRDGKPSRTVLLHNFSDRRLQEFLLERSYPPASDLDRLARALTGDWVEPAALARSLRLDNETLASALDKLIGAGVAQMDMAGNVQLAAAPTAAWKSGYEAQVAARRAQIDRMIAFAEGTRCRMAALVQHFGDRSDGGRPCGRCDICSPERSLASPMRQPGAEEVRALREILSALGRNGTSVGKLFEQTRATADRKQFDAWIDALARAGLVALSNETFRSSEGRDVTYRKATLTPEGREPDDDAMQTIWLRDATPSAGSSSKRSKSKSSTTKTSAKTSAKSAAPVDKSAWTAAQHSLESQLRAWRKHTAAETHAPAFIVLADTVLESIVSALPRTVADLEQVRGIGREKADKYGAAILKLCREAAPAAASPTPKPRVPQVSFLRPGMNDSPQPRSAAASPTPKARVPRVSLLRPGTNDSHQPTSPLPLTPEQQVLETRLRSWRSDQARAAGLPSFFIFSDTALRSIVDAEPQSLHDLRNVRGFSPDQVLKYGEAVLGLCRA